MSQSKVARRAGQKALSPEGQNKLAGVLADWISFDPGDRPEALTTLDWHRKRQEQIVTKAVLSRHEPLLQSIFEALPRSPPNKMSMWPALLEACARHDRLRETTASRLSWAKDECEKLWMIWRYVWSSLGRSDGSRCYSAGRLKTIFLPSLGPLSDGQVTRLSGEVSVGSRSPSYSPSPSRREPAVELVCESPEPAAASGKAPEKASEKASVKAGKPSEKASVKAGKPSKLASRRRSLVRNISVQSVPSSAPGSPPPHAVGSLEAESPRTPPARKRGRSPPLSLEKFLVPAPRHVACTPVPKGRIRLMTPVTKAKKGKKGKKGKGKKSKSEEKAPVVKASTVTKGTKAPVVKAPPMKAMKAPTRTGATSKRATGGHDGGPSSGEFMGWEAPTMDFTHAGAREWAENIVKTRGLLKADHTPEQTPNHSACKLRKLEQASRENSRLIQVVRDGRLLGQVTEKAFSKAQGVMFASSVLQFVGGEGYSKEAFMHCKQNLLFAD